MSERNRHEQKKCFNEAKQVENYNHQHHYPYNNKLNAQTNEVNSVKEEKVDKCFNNIKVDMNNPSVFQKAESSFYHPRKEMKNKYGDTDMNVHRGKMGTTTATTTTTNNNMYNNNIYNNNNNNNNKIYNNNNNNIYNNNISNTNTIIPPHDIPHMKRGIYAQMSHMYNNSNILKHNDMKNEVRGEQKNNYHPNKNMNMNMNINMNVNMNKGYNKMQNDGRSNVMNVEKKLESKETKEYELCIDGSGINNYVELYIHKAKEIYYFHVFYNYLKLGWPEKEAAEESKKYIFITLNNYFSQMKQTIFSSPQFVKRVNSCVASNLLYYQEPTNLHQFLQQLQMQPQSSQTIASVQPPSNSFFPGPTGIDEKKKQASVQNKSQNVNMFDLLNLQSFDMSFPAKTNDTSNDYSEVEGINNVNHEAGSASNNNNSNDKNNNKKNNNNNTKNVLKEDSTNKQWNFRDNSASANDTNIDTPDSNKEVNAYNVKGDKIDEMIKGIEEMKRLSEQKKRSRKRIFSDVPIYDENNKYNFSEGREREVLYNELQGGSTNNAQDISNIRNTPNIKNNVANKHVIDSCNNTNSNTCNLNASFLHENTVHAEEKKKIRFSINTGQSKVYQKMKVNINKADNLLRSKQGFGKIDAKEDQYPKDVVIEELSEVSNISDDKTERKERGEDGVGERERDRERERGTGKKAETEKKKKGNEIGVRTGTGTEPGNGYVMPSTTNNANKQFTNINNGNSQYLNNEMSNFQRLDNSTVTNESYEAVVQQRYNMYRFDKPEQNSYNIKSDTLHDRDVKGNMYYEHNIDPSRGNDDRRTNYLYGSMKNIDQNSKNTNTTNTTNNNNNNNNSNNHIHSMSGYTPYHENTRLEKNNLSINESNVYQMNDVSNMYNMTNMTNMYNCSTGSVLNDPNRLLKEKNKINENSHVTNNVVCINNKNNIVTNDRNGHNYGYNYANNKMFYQRTNGYGIDPNTQNANFFDYHSNIHNEKSNIFCNNSSNAPINSDNNNNNVNKDNNNMYNNININNNNFLEKNNMFENGNRESENKLKGTYMIDTYKSKRNKIKAENTNTTLYKFAPEGEGVEEEEEGYDDAFEENSKREKKREREKQEKEKEKEKEKGRGKEKEKEKGKGKKRENDKEREDMWDEDSDESERNHNNYETEIHRTGPNDKKNMDTGNLPELAFFSDNNKTINNQNCYLTYIEKLKFYYKDLLKNRDFGKQFNYFVACLNSHKNKNDGVASLWLENIIPSVDNICRANQFIRGFFAKKKNNNEKKNSVVGKTGTKGIMVDPQMKQKIEDVQSKEKRKERFFGGMKTEKGDANDNLFYFDSNAKVDRENTYGNNLEKLIEMYDDISCYKNKDFVGQCKSIQKFFFRLTSLPEPKNVRSFSVLKCTYAYILYKYNQDRNYKYVNEQFRSLRQDLNIQSILHTDVINIYETNIRICIVNNDLFQFLQCINKLFEMYQKLNINKSKVEFLCYKMIYLTLQNMHQEFCQVYFNLTEEERNDENIQLCLYLNDCVKNKMYLINVNMIEPIDNDKNHDYIYSRIYVNNRILNYMAQLMDLSENSVLNINVEELSSFIKEHGDLSKTEKVTNVNFVQEKNGTCKMPYLTNCLITLFLPKYRLLALINICKTSMKVNISTLTKLLNFKDDEACLMFLKEVNADISNNDVLTKSSLTNLLKSPLLKNRYINHIR